MDDRFSQIETMWSMVRRAHDDGLTVAGQAQQDLLERYGGAVRRYARSEEHTSELQSH